MGKTGIFVLGLIGSILGMLGSIFWMFIGTFFFAGMIDYELPTSAPITDEAFVGGLLIAGIQSLITISMFIVTLVKSTPVSLDKGMKNSGIWLLVLGIVGAVINIINLVPCILLIIAGALGLQGAKHEDDGNVRFIEEGGEKQIIP